MLSHDIATELRGKAISTKVFPLSFAEFLTFNNSPYSQSTKGLAETRRLFDEYLNWGAYPAMASIHDAYLQEHLLYEYFDTMIDLSYPELYGRNYLYKRGKLRKSLLDKCVDGIQLKNEQRDNLTDSFDWKNCKKSYENFLI